MREVCVLLSQRGDSLKVFLKDELEGYQEVKGKVIPRVCEKNCILLTQKELLDELINAQGSQEILSVLIKLRDNKQLISSFLFLHEQMNAFPDHCENVMFIPNVSSIGTSCLAHSDALEKMIQFIEEYCFNSFETEYRKNYVAGFNHQRKSWLESGWVWNACTQYNNEAFKEGRQAALRKR
jgi:hypothetical protein